MKYPTTIIENLKQKCDFQINFPENDKETPDGYLITFGCSWTYGVGSHWEPGMTEKEYKETAWDHELVYQHSWRKIISDQLNLTNINFSEAGVSNDYQFTVAEIFFSSDLWKFIEETSKPVVVLWGTTALIRKTVWNVKEHKNCTLCIDNEYSDSFVNFPNRDERIIRNFERIYAKLFFDPSVELNNLWHKMHFWNTFFEKANVKNFWFDSFNSFNYPRQIKNLIGYENSNRDLLFYLCKINGDIIIEDEMHKSGWCIDNKKIEFLFKNNLVNPYSFHPTKNCHKQIGEFFMENLL